MAGDDREHRHGHLHPEEADWEALAAHLEMLGELLVGFVTETIDWALQLRGPDAPPVRRVLDIGSGPGVGSCELARLFPDADVVAVDGSQAMLDRVKLRAAAEGVDGRIGTCLAELPSGLERLERADLIWASMSLHHIPDEAGALRGLRDLLEPSGLIVIAERAEPMRVLPDALDLGRPGLVDRIDQAEEEWFAAMREGVADAEAATDQLSMLQSAGLEVLGTRLARQDFEAPVSDAVRRVVLGHLRRVRAQLTERLGEEDMQTLEVLVDTDDPRGVMHRPDVLVAASRHTLVARPLPHDPAPSNRRAD